MAAAGDTVDIPVDDEAQPSAATAPETITEARQQMTVAASDWVARLGLVCLPVIWVMLALWNKGAVLFPVVFIPTIVALLVWKCKGRDKSVGFWALTSAYMKGFFLGFLVQIYQVICLVIVVMILYSTDWSDASYVLVLIVYSFLGAGWSSEYAKYRIAKRARSDRPDLNDVFSFLWYSVAGAMGLTTCCISIITFTDFGGTLPLDDVIIILLVVTSLQLPTDVLTGYIIGVGVAKNEVFKWNLPGYKIWGLPVLIRALGSVTFYIIMSYSPIAALVMYLLIIIAAGGYAHFASSNLPDTFQGIPSVDPDENPDVPTTEMNIRA
eukprot:TRINITY_DN1429_c0_g1_i1.p2 TRINITY_DN1429_c0_g1~~TRINITY_DN1429_c0_g1_i1.p2  ORF type:complete len:324 (-),score=93.62 TRINITY_DN1429_c0_g1_i1:591-1562(-)